MTRHQMCQPPCVSPLQVLLHRFSNRHDKKATWGAIWLSENAQAQPHAMCTCIEQPATHWQLNSLIGTWQKPAPTNVGPTAHTHPHPLPQQKGARAPHATRTPQCCRHT